ncbi:MAG: uracil-DNA glycosylase [Ruminococcus sp.]|jgi:uracil-DNA glycosylase|nr:uracil-DNA glycosylase [Ruminococcus sp.]
MVNIGNGWDKLLASEFDSEHYKKLREFLKYEYAHFRIYPGMYDIYNALRFTPPEAVHAVILGQDPYHGAGQAHGLCFSVKPGVQKPPSLVNIYKELNADLGIPIPKDGCLENWAKQGVLLLNTVLTVREGAPNSHRGKGWEVLTDRIISIINESENPTVFILWGGNARAKKGLITNPRHLVLEAAHPSPLSAYNGFFGCRHFSKTNAFLAQNSRGTIDFS